MPLSEDEQRILSEIEQQLYETDPALAREVAETTIYSHAFRNIKWGLLGFVVGVAFMVVTLSTSFWLAFGGFLVMLASALFIEHNARRLGRAGLQQITETMRGSGLRGYLGNSSERMRERFRKDGDTTEE